jgi:hypothetical protein
LERVDIEDRLDRVLPDTSNDDGIDVDGEDGFVITSSLVTFKVITQFLTMSFSSPSHR